MQKFLSRWKWRMKARWRATDNKHVIWVLLLSLLALITSFKPIFLLAISQLIRMYLTAQRFRHCCRSIARYFPLCLSFGRCIFGTKLFLNIIGGHQNHYNRPVATQDEIVDLWQLNTVNTRSPCLFFSSPVPGTSERRQFTWC